MSELTTISNGILSATVNSEGAELTSLKLDGDEYLWQGDPAYWAKRAPILFPMVGSLRDGQAISARGVCTMGRHGVARDYEHALVKRTETSLTYELCATPDTLKAFPFKFKLNMTYAIVDDKTLAQTFTVTNTGDVYLPYCVGGHPAFNVPVPGSEGEAFEDYELKFTRPWTCHVPLMTDDGLIDYEQCRLIPDISDTVAITHRLFANDALMFSNVPDSDLTLLGTKSGHSVTVKFDGFNYIGVWSANNGAPFVALEPWTGHSTAEQEDDIFEHKAGTTILAPGKTNTHTFTITLA